MKKMSVSDAAEYFGVSREAIHNRIRRGTLEAVVEKGVKLVLVDGEKMARAKATSKQVKNNDERYYKLLEEQNAKLQSRVEVLESETRTLRDQKELMLVQERQKIEAIYKEKDEQLKNILSTISSQFMLNAPEPLEEIEELVEAEIEEEVVSKEGIVSLKKYLKRKKYSKEKAKKVQEKFQKKAKKDERIIVIDKKFYLDFVKYDYKGLL
jgi:hydroxymethylpyrimidine pyrophosphatase-like HAD family hydrolase